MIERSELNTSHQPLTTSHGSGRSRAGVRGPAAFLFAGGGTGGHVIPGLAVARELRQRGHSAFFVGTERGLESNLVPREGFPLELIHIGGLKRVGLRQTAATLMQLPVSTLYSRRLLKDRQRSGGLQHGRLRRRTSRNRRADPAHPHHYYGAQCGAGLYQSADRAVCAPRAD